MAKRQIGIVRTKTECRAYVRVRGILYTKRFDPDTSTITDMRDWRAATRVEQLRKHKDRAGKGSFAADVQAYLAAVKAMPTYAEREQHLDHWLAALGPERPRASITSAEVRAVLQQWRLSGKRVTEKATDATGTVSDTVKQVPLSESACNHRRTALMHFFTVLNGRSGSNPVKDVPKFREPDPEPRGVPFSELQKVFAVMPNSATRARVLVLAFTGLPPSTLMRLEPSAVHYDTATVTVPRRRKGKGTKTRTLPLTKEALQAFRLLTRFDAWGEFSRDALRHSLQRACRKAGIPVIRAYDLRHSFATAVYQQSGDIKAVQALLDHSDQKLTDRYTLGAVDARQRLALAAVRKVTGKVTKSRKSA